MNKPTLKATPELYPRFGRLLRPNVGCHSSLMCEPDVRASDGELDGPRNAESCRGRMRSPSISQNSNPKRLKRIKQNLSKE